MKNPKSALEKIEENQNQDFVFSMKTHFHPLFLRFVSDKQKILTSFLLSDEFR